METRKEKIDLRYLIGVVVAIIILAIVCASVDSIKNVFAQSNAEGDLAVEANKSVTWTDEYFSKGKIEIEAKVTGKVETTPDVLFIGTMCSAHELTADTIAKALNAITITSNVDYFLYNNENSSRQSKDKSGSLNMGQKVKASDFTIDTTANHQALGKFFKCIYEQHNKHVQTSGKGYDFIVLEFDGTRISDWYRHLSPEDEKNPTTPDGDYKKYVNEEATVNILKSYYENNQVIWITDEDWTEGVPKSGYNPTRKMNVRRADYTTRKINYNSLLGLLAPSLYVQTSDTPESSASEIEEIDASLPDPSKGDYPTDPLSKDYVLDNDRQVGYENSDKVGAFLEQQIHGLYTYKLNINDMVDIDDNIKFDTSDVVLYEKKKSTDSWVEFKGTYTPTIDPSTGQVSFEIPDLEGDEFFKVEINFENKSATETFIEKSLDGNPNDGPVTEIVTPEAGSPDSDEEDIDPEHALNWPININYKVENDCVDEDAYVTNELDEDIFSIPTSGHIPAGSIANFSDGDTYEFVNWTLGETGDVVSTQASFTPPPNEDTGRYYEATYVAHFRAKYSIIKYFVQGAEVPGQADYVTPSDSITPSDEVVAFGTKDYPLQGSIPTTAWITSDGTENGISGTWTFLGNCWYDDQSFNNPISKIDDVVLNEYKVYGKWVFTPTLSIEKTANWNDKTQPAKAGDLITYSISVSNNSDFVVENVNVSDNVPVELIVDVSSITGGGVLGDNNVITWNISSLPAKSNVILSFSAKAPLSLSSVTTFANSAIIYADQVNVQESNEVNTIVNPSKSKIVVSKEWQDGADKHINQNLKVNLYGHTNDYNFSKLVTLNENFDGTWASEVDELDIYDSNGVMITYFVKELDKDGNEVEENTKFVLSDKAGNESEYYASYSYEFDEGYAYSAAKIHNYIPAKKGDISIVKTADKEVYNAGDDVLYTLSVTNNSGVYIGNVIVEDNVPENLDIVDAGEGIIDEHKVTWVIKAIEPETTFDIKLKCKVPLDTESTIYVNEAKLNGYSEITPDKPSPEIYINPPEQGKPSFDITKFIVKSDGLYIHTNEENENVVELKYVIHPWQIEINDIDNLTVVNHFEPGIVPANPTPEWEQQEDGSYIYTHIIENPQTTQDLEFNVDIVVYGSDEEAVTYQSDCNLTAKVSADTYNTYSNKVDVNIPVLIDDPIEPDPVVIREVKDIKAIKIWSDAQTTSHDSDAVEFTLKWIDDNGQEISEKQIVDKSTAWQCEWKNSANKKYYVSYIDGSPINYSVEETPVENYDTAYSKDGEVFVVTNTYNGEPPVPPEPGIASAVKTASLESGSDSAKPGDVIDYKIEITNGQIAIDNVMITDDVDDILLVSNISGQANIDENNVITWSNIKLGAGEVYSVSFKAKIPETLDSDIVITNVGVATSDLIEQKESNITQTTVKIDNSGGNSSLVSFLTNGGVSTGDILNGLIMLISAVLFVVALFIIKARKIRIYKERG